MMQAEHQWATACFELRLEPAMANERRGAGGDKDDADNYSDNDDDDDENDKIELAPPTTEGGRWASIWRAKLAPPVGLRAERCPLKLLEQLI